MTRYRCVDAHKAAGFPVATACQAAGVTRSGYYAWASTTRRPAHHQQEQARLVGEIRAIHRDSHGTYGSPRVHAELRRRGWGVNHKRIERLMRAHGIVGPGPAAATVSPSPTALPCPHPTCWAGCSTPTGRMWPGAAV